MLATLKTSWENELNFVLTDLQWDSALRLVHLSSICARHNLIQCKIIHIIHYTNAKLARLFQDINNTCNKCNLAPANHVHMFWSCPKLKIFWDNIFDTINNAYALTIPANPLSAIFGIHPDDDSPTTIKRALSFMTLLGRRLIWLNWKTTRAPSHIQWIREVLLNLKLEKLRFSLAGSLKRFTSVWNPLLTFVSTLNLSPDSEEE